MITMNAALGLLYSNMMYSLLFAKIFVLHGKDEVQRQTMNCNITNNIAHIIIICLFKNLIWIFWL